MSAGKIASIVLLVSMYALFVKAELDAPSQEALTKTQETLTSAQKREAVQKENPKYQESEKALDHLYKGNQGQKQETYELASQVLATLAEKANGDPKKMQEIITQAQQNPEKFMQEYFSEVQKQQVRALANDLEKDKNTPVPPQVPRN